MVRQIGFGWGRGRQVIKTIYAGDRLQAALARQRQWFARHGVEDAAPQRLGGLNQTETIGPIRGTTGKIHETKDLIHETTGPIRETGRIIPTLRMAKADLRRETPGALGTTSDVRGGLETPGAPRAALRARSSSSYASPDPLASYTPS